MTRSSALTMGALALLAVLALPGCRRPSGTTDDTAPRPNSGNPLQPNFGGAPAQGDIRRGAERQVDQSLLKQIGMYYINYNLERNRSPASVEELTAYMKGAPNQHLEALKLGWIVMVPNAPTNANTIILYEKHKYEKFNNRLAAFGDGRVELMNEDAFQRALKGGQ